jgi:hypothetical protein
MLTKYGNVETEASCGECSLAFVAAANAAITSVVAAAAVVSG